MSKEYFECLDKMRSEQFIKDISIIQEQVSNKSFTKMCFSTNTQESIIFHRKDCEHEVIGHLNNLNDLLMKDVLFNRFIAKCVNNSKIEETTLIGMFAEFLTMMSDCENRNIKTKSSSQGWARQKDLNDLKFVMCEDVGEELRHGSKSFSEFLQKLRKKIQDISKQDEQTFKNKQLENYQLSCVINSLSLQDRDELLENFVRSYVFRE